MQTDHILAFNAALLIALISPGPAFLLVLRTGVSCGKSAGLALGAGQGVAAAFWTLAALAGLEGVFHLFPWAYSAVKIVGAARLKVGAATAIDEQRVASEHQLLAR